MSKKITQDDFIKSVKLIHGENIDFSNAVYIKDNVDEDNLTFKDCNKLLNEIEKYEL